MRKYSYICETTIKKASLEFQIADMGPFSSNAAAAWPQKKMLD